MKKIITWIGLALTLTIGMQANAALINGGFAYSGGAFVSDADYAAQTVTSIDFTPSSNVFTVENAGGDFAAYNGVDGVISNITIDNPFTGISPLLTINPDFTFELVTINVNYVGYGIIALSGNGLFNLTGFEETSGSWNMTLNTIQGYASFSGSAVPEPGTLALFGMGLLGLAFARRNRKA